MADGWTGERNNETTKRGLLVWAAIVAASSSACGWLLLVSGWCFRDRSLGVLCRAGRYVRRHESAEPRERTPE